MRLEKRGHAILVDGMPAESRLVFPSGESRSADYATLDARGSGLYSGTIRGRIGGLEYRVEDRWSLGPEEVRLTREIRAGDSGGRSVDGIGVRLALPIGPGRWRFFVPAACYDYCPVEGPEGSALVSEERMAYPLVMAYKEETRRAILLARETLARSSRPVDRKPGERRVLHSTEIGALGYRRASAAAPARLIAALPYCEEPSSRMLDRSLSPITAFLPPSETAISVTYRIALFEAAGFDAACLEGFVRAHALSRPEPVEPPVGLQECIRARLDCLSGLAHNWRGHTGLSLNFDPRLGVGSPPSGYGTSFNKLEESIYPDILEYGFTGRPLNNAFMLAALSAPWGRPGWAAPARRLVESYLRSCVAKSGFLYTLYDVRRGRAISPFGDPVGSLLHYGAKGAEEGNYIRNMAEAAADLCLFSSVALDASCLEAARRFGDFLLRTQNRDGSWYRAYTPDGRAIMKPEEWFGASDRANKSSTSTAIPFLLELARASGANEYRSAAIRAGEWLLSEVVERIDYRGGTLDNPNVVDKEGMAYAMSALLRLHDATRAPEFLEGALRAGGLSLTWNHLWDVPLEEGTRLAENGFKSRGWGGISILWGAGVVDIYSLWFLADWIRLGELSRMAIYSEVSALVLHGTQQMLSLPGRPAGLVGSGMQEEGFACSHQGVDEGMIAKGSTWGSLGWVFAAGTYGVWQALSEEERRPSNLR